MFLAKGVCSVNQLFSLDIVAWIWGNFPFEKVTSKRLAKILVHYFWLSGAIEARCMHELAFIKCFDSNWNGRLFNLFKYWCKFTSILWMGTISCRGGYNHARFKNECNTGLTRNHWGLSLVENQLWRILPFEWYLLAVVSLTTVYKG